MIYLKKELLRAYASSSSISVLCVITLWQRSNAWQGQSSVQDKFCSKQTQPLLQTDLPLHVHTRRPAKSQCCLNVSSLGGSLTKVESLTVANFTRNLFRSIWHHFDFPFGSYSLDISFRFRSTELSMSEHSIREKSLNWLGVSYIAFNIDFFPIPKNEEVVSHPVRA
jgi:hypothetical protein